MKNLIIILSFIGMGCSSKQPHIASESNKDKLLVVQIIDYSKSIRINHFDTVAARNLYYTIARLGGCIKVIGVYDNSNLQDIYSLQIPKIDTQSTDGIKNIYQAGRIKAENQRIIAAFEQQAAKDLAEYISQVSKPCTTKFTDLSSSLVLAQTTLSEPVYNKGYKKTLLLCTDMINDVQGKEHDALIPVQLQNTQVVFIRPSLPVEKLKSLFPNSSVFSFTTSTNAISFLNQ